MIELAAVISRLETHWSGVSPAGVPTQFPGVPLDASRLECWYEFWLTQIDEPPRRTGGVDRRQLVLDVQCFARGRDKRKVAVLADAVQRELAHRDLPLAGIAAEGTSDGWLRLREAQLRDLTREVLDAAQPPLQHIVVSIVAVLEAG